MVTIQPAENPLHYDEHETAQMEYPPPDEPMKVARQLMKDDRTVEGCPTLRYWRGGWISWDGPVWSESEKKAVERWVYTRLEHAAFLKLTDKGVMPVAWNPNRRKIGDVLDAMSAIAHLPETVHPPEWLRPGGAFPADEAVTCTNGILHVPTGTLHPLTPWHFSHVAVPFDYDENAPDPKHWLDFLDQLWPDDPDSIAALQEWFGYVLSGRTDMHKIMLMLGPTRSGKGTIARILAALIGKGNVASPTLASMNTNFGLSPLIGCPLAIVQDARLGKSSNQVVERLLSISGEDMLTIDRKYKEPWTGKLPARFLIVSNELPELGDASGAIAHRFIVLSMTKSFLGKEDHGLTNRLLAELPGILRWALDGFTRLGKNDAFTVPESSESAVLALQDLVSPIAAFIRDNCSRTGDVLCDEVYAAYRSWCDENGYNKPKIGQFGKDLRTVIPTLRVTQPRVGTSRERRYVGLSLGRTHNAQDRVPARADAEDATDMSGSGDVARAGTRTSPMCPPLDVPLPTEPPEDPWAAEQAATEAAEAAPAALRRVRCPSCRWQFKTSVQPGETAHCGKCSHEFTVPGKDTQ
jgi:putative DNA primase/helicase